MSQPLLVEAIEDHFIPIVVYNNQADDAATLKAFGEPSWNNPVVRFIDKDGKDIIKRKDGVYSIPALVARLIASLKAAKREVPAFLETVSRSWASELQHATFAMAWYWTGEAQLGSMDGVYSTRSAWAGHHEVVHVTYDPEIIDYGKLLAGARRMKCTSAVYTYDDLQLKIAKRAGTSNIIPWKPSLETRSVRKSEQKYHLRNTTLAYLPLNELQAVKLNVLAGHGRSKRSEVTKILSPRQIALMGQISGVLSENPDLLSGLSFPEDQSKLAAYNNKLLKRLETAKK